MNRQARAGPTMGCPYAAVGMQRALDSAIGLPSRSTSASWMLGFLMPADVRRSRMMPLLLASGSTVGRPSAERQLIGPVPRSLQRR